MSALLFTQTSDPQLSRQLLGAAQNEDTVQDVTKLLDKGVPVDVTSESGDTALIFCTRSNRLDLVNVLLERGADPNHCNKAGMNPLLISSRSGYFQIFQLLLNKKANINQRSRDGDTPLSYAVLNDHTEIAIALINARAEINYLTPKEGNSLLHEIAKRGNAKLLNALLNQTAKPIDINSQNKAGLTPLMLAVLGNKEEIVKILISKNCNVNSIDKDGRTALMYACQVDSDTCASLLIEKNASVDIADNNGRTANHYLTSDSSRTASVLSGAGGRWVTALKSLLDQRQLPYATANHLLPDRHTSLTLNLRTGSGAGSLAVVIIVPRSGSRVVIRTGSVSIIENRRAAVADFLVRLNHVMTDGVFEMEMKKGMVRFRSSLLFNLSIINHSSEVPIMAFKHLIDYHINELDPYFMAIELVAEGNSPTHVFDRYIAGNNPTQSN